jgi:hypothetical protein
MTFEPRRFPGESAVYRGIESKGHLDRQRDPWGVRLKAFLRKAKDYDGLTVVPEPYHCCHLNIF